MYKHNKDEFGEFIFRVNDNSFIPIDDSNIDYQEYLEWLAEGNEPEVIN